jgi:hypothetical protein
VEAQKEVSYMIKTLKMEWRLFKKNKQNYLFVFAFVLFISLRIFIAYVSKDSDGYSISTRMKLAENWINSVSLLLGILSSTSFAIEHENKTLYFRATHTTLLRIYISKVIILFLYGIAMMSIYFFLNRSIIQLDWVPVLIPVFSYVLIGALFGIFVKNEYAVIIIIGFLWLADSLLFTNFQYFPIQAALRML